MIEVVAAALLQEQKNTSHQPDTKISDEARHDTLGFPRQTVSTSTSSLAECADVLGKYTPHIEALILLCLDSHY